MSGGIGVFRISPREHKIIRRERSYLLHFWFEKVTYVPFPWSNLAEKTVPNLKNTKDTKIFSVVQQFSNMADQVYFLVYSSGSTTRVLNKITEKLQMLAKIHSEWFSK